MSDLEFMSFFCVLQFLNGICHLKIPCKDMTRRGRGRKPVIIKLISGDEGILPSLEDTSNEVQEMGAGEPETGKNRNGSILNYDHPVPISEQKVIGENILLNPTHDNEIILSPTQNLETTISKLCREQQATKRLVMQLVNMVKNTPPQFRNNSVTTGEEEGVWKKLPKNKPPPLTPVPQIPGMTLEESVEALLEMKGELKDVLSRRRAKIEHDTEIISSGESSSQSSLKVAEESASSN